MLSSSLHHFVACKEEIYKKNMNARPHFTCFHYGYAINRRLILFFLILSFVRFARMQLCFVLLILCCAVYVVDFDFVPEPPESSSVIFMHIPTRVN